MSNHDQLDTATFGFWVYLMTDCVLFAALFATYAVLHGNTFGGPSGHDLFHLPYVLKETLLLLTSSFTMGLAVLSAKKANVSQVVLWLTVTALLGFGFLGLELSEFHTLIQAGITWRTSGFLSSYFVLVGTHGLHITFGLLWILVLIVQVTKKGLKQSVLSRLGLLSMFWHFLDIIWIFIFTLVYLMGAK